MVALLTCIVPSHEGLALRAQGCRLGGMFKGKRPAPATDLPSVVGEMQGWMPFLKPRLGHFDADDGRGPTVLTVMLHVLPDRVLWAREEGADWVWWYGSPADDETDMPAMYFGPQRLMTPFPQAPGDFYIAAGADPQWVTAGLVEQVLAACDREVAEPSDPEATRIAQAILRGSDAPWRR